MLQMQMDKMGACQLDGSAQAHRRSTKVSGMTAKAIEQRHVPLLQLLDASQGHATGLGDRINHEDRKLDAKTQGGNQGKDKTAATARLEAWHDMHDADAPIMRVGQVVPITHAHWSAFSVPGWVIGVAVCSNITGIKL